jgi:hypothetical protein
MKTITILGAALIATSAAAQSPRLLTVSAQDDQLREVDSVTGATLNSVQMVIPGQPQILQAHGCAVDPTSGNLYAIVSLVPLGTKNLLVVDPVTGVATDLGDTGEKFAGITFDSTGQLWGISGDGGVISEALYKIDKSTAQSGFVLQLGNGGPGESLAFNPADGLLYHGSGSGTLNDPLLGAILETIDPATLAVTPVTLSGAGAIGVTSMTRLDASTLIGTDFGLKFIRVKTSGAMTVTGLLDHLAKGFAWVDGPSFFANGGIGCVGSGGFMPVITGSGVPNPAESAVITISQALGGAPSVLFVGLGTGSVALNGSCSMQIMPLSPIAISLPMFGVGPGGGGIAIPFTIPATTPPLDLYVQVLIGDNGVPGGIASTGRLRLHIQ